jgi:hypothetical protein
VPQLEILRTRPAIAPVRLTALPNDRLAVVSENGSRRLWHAGWDPQEEWQGLEEPLGEGSELAMDWRTKRLYGMDDSFGTTLVVFEVASGTPRRLAHKHEESGAATGLPARADGNWLTGLGTLWDVSDPQAPRLVRADGVVTLLDARGLALTTRGLMNLTDNRPVLGNLEGGWKQVRGAHHYDSKRGRLYAWNRGANRLEIYKLAAQGQ